MHKVHILDNKECLQSYVSDYLFEKISNREIFNIALSGGRTPLGVFSNLKKNNIEMIDRDDVNIFWVDERYVSHSNERSNFGNAYRLLFSDMKNINIFPIPTNKDIYDCAELYKRTLTKNLTTSYDGSSIFDFVLLGVGEDGHVASLFDDKNNSSESVMITKDGNDESRITLTAQTINNSTEIMLIATGSKKGSIINDFLEGNSIGRGINLIDRDLNIVLDKEAAESLNHALMNKYDLYNSLPGK
jgi:6-phosphogluconolactonase